MTPEGAAQGLGVRAWLRSLLHPVTPGMDAESPRAHWVPAVIILALLALQVVARYRWDFMKGPQWQAVHIAIGWAMVVVVLGLWHGWDLLRRVRRRTWVLLLAGGVLFCLFWYFGRMDSYRRYWQASIGTGGAMAPVYPFIYFSSAAFLFRTILPFGFARGYYGLTAGDLGLRARGNPHRQDVRGVGWVYLALFIGVLPFVVAVADNPAFLAKYPMSRTMVAPDNTIALEHFLIYEAFYLLIFVSGEGFWRGYLTFSAEKDLGLYALMMMLVPYVTAHFGKPLPETLGALAAGLTLGFLALKHRSVWYGVAVHYGVALSMDLLAVRGNGFVITTGP